MLLLLKGSKVTLCAQKMTKRLITLLVLLSVCHFGKIKCDCDYFFPNGLGRVLKIKSGPQLEPSLKKGWSWIWYHTFTSTKPSNLVTSKWVIHQLTEELWSLLVDTWYNLDTESNPTSDSLVNISQLQNKNKQKPTKTNKPKRNDDENNNKEVW